MARDQRSRDAELVEWGLIRVRMGNSVSLHAVGLRVRHPHEESRIVVTSPVRSVSDNRGSLETQNSIYDLVREIEQFPEDHCKHHVRLIALKGIQPDRIDWLRPDGTIYRSMESAELAEIAETETATRDTFGQKLLDRKGTVDPDADLEF